MIERAIVFPCGEDDLVGILHEPGATERQIGVLIVVGGPQYRVGSHRQFVLMARSFAVAGYPTLRFDYRGMGDSTGDARTFEAIDDDIRAGIDALMAASRSISEVVIFGLCDAASAALIYCPRDKRIAGLILANPWARTEAGNARTVVKHYYGRRLLQRSFWAKLGTGELRIVSSAKSLLVSLIDAVRHNRGGNSVRSEHFLVRMRRGAQAFGGPILLLLSERDLTAREFDDLCRRSAAWTELMARRVVESRSVLDADHTFSAPESLESAAEQSLRWLEALPGR